MVEHGVSARMGLRKRKVDMLSVTVKRHHNLNTKISLIDVMGLIASGCCGSIWVWIDGEAHLWECAADAFCDICSADVSCFLYSCRSRGLRILILYDVENHLTICIIVSDDDGWYCEIIHRILVLVDVCYMVCLAYKCCCDSNYSQNKRYVYSSNHSYDTKILIL